MTRQARRVALAFAVFSSMALSSSSFESAPDNAAHPFAQHALDHSRWTTLVGTVEERVSAGPYAYLRVRSGEREVWVVALAALSARTGRVRVTVIGRAESFASPRLHRTFAPLLFGVVRAASEPLQVAERN